MLTGCGSNETTEPTAPIRIGFLSSFSGEAAAYGKMDLSGVELAVEQLNRAGGLLVEGQRRPIELVVRDTGALPEQALEGALELFNRDRIVALIGPFNSDTAIPVAVAAEQARVPMISPTATHPDVTAGKQFVFRVSFLDASQARALARFVFDELNIRRVASLFDMATPHSRNVAETFQREFEGLGALVVASEHYYSGEKNFTSALERIRVSDAEAVLLPNLSYDVLLQSQQARELGLEATLLGSDSWSKNVLAGEPGVQGAYISDHWHPDIGNVESQQFLVAYQTEYDLPPGGGAALGFDAVGMLGRVIESQNSLDSEALRRGLAELDGYRGVTGSISYEGSGDPIRSTVMLQYLDGEAVFHSLVTPEPPE